MYHLLRDEVVLYQSGQDHTIKPVSVIKGLHNPELTRRLGYFADDLREQMELVKGASQASDLSAF